MSFRLWANRGLSVAIAYWACAGAVSTVTVRAANSGIAARWLHEMPSGIDPGELLAGELNCVACHSAEPAIQKRLVSKQAPVLAEVGARITPQYLRSFLEDPANEKPGTTMPDLLHGLAPSEKSETIDALVQFLMSLNSTSPASPVGADAFKIQQGRQLYHRIGCVVCHAPFDTAAAISAKAGGSEPSSRIIPKSTELAEFSQTSIPLGNLAKKTTVNELAKFLMDPLTVRPAGRMPSMNLRDNEAVAIAMYLLREQALGLYSGIVPLQKVKGVAYQYFEANINDSANLDSLTPTATGFRDRFTVRPRQRADNVGFRFNGFISIKDEGDYTFFTSSDDGSSLSIGNQIVVQNEGMHGIQEKKGTIRLPPGEHPIQVTWYNGNGESVLRVSYEGPGLAKQEIPAAVLSHLGQAMDPLGREEFQVNADKANRGKELFASLGCAACHQTGGEQPAPTPSLAAKAWSQLNPQNTGGCASSAVKSGRPKYGWNETQRAAILATLTRREILNQPLEPKLEVQRLMATMNCYACHSRDGFGGPEPGRNEYFTVVGEADLGDEGRIPPHLNRVGEKLRPAWLREVLTSRGIVRPYVATRMPQFGPANVEPLVSAILQADATGTPVDRPDHPESATKWGRKLVGREGLSCIACHNFGPHKSLGIPAMDLTMMARRLDQAWFVKYLLDPAGLRPGTRMPTFWPEGKSVNQDILNGNTDQQIGAIWAYLSLGKEAPVPAGLVQSKMEILVDREAVIYRNFIAGAGSRAIGVGYPEKANLAFDANQLRWALIWHGAFIDAARHRMDRGVGFEPPLGDNILEMPPGAPFAILPDSAAPWPATTGKNAGYQMKGYRLDDKRRPTFIFTFQDIRIEDYPVVIAGEFDPAFHRTITCAADKPVLNLWFRAAVGNQIETKSDGSYSVQGKMTLKFNLASDAKPVIRQSGGQSELLVPVVFSGKESKIVEQIIW